MQGITQTEIAAGQLGSIDPFGRAALERALSGVPDRRPRRRCICWSCRTSRRRRCWPSPAHVRTQRKGRTVTYSPKVFLPITNLCRDRCSYCTFRQDPDDPDAWTMLPEEVARLRHARPRPRLHRGADVPRRQAGARLPLVSPDARRARARQHGRVRRARCCAIALDEGLLPHTNAGLLSARRDGAAEAAQRQPRPHARDRSSPRLRAARRRPPAGARQGSGAAPGDDARRRRAADPVHHRHPARHRRDARGARRQPARHRRPARRATATSRRSSSRTSAPSRPRAWPTAPEPSSLDIARTIAVARLMLPEHEHAGAAEPQPVRPPPLPRRRHQRLGRHLAAHARLREPRGAVAAGAGARRAPARDEGFTLAPRLPIYRRVRRPARLSRSRRCAPRARRARAGTKECIMWDDLRRAVVLRQRVRSTSCCAPRRPADGAPASTAPSRGDELTVDEGEHAARASTATTSPPWSAPPTPCAPPTSATRSPTSSTATSTSPTSASSAASSAPSRVQRKEADAYNHSIDDVLGKVQDAIDRGASEVCMQGGINPEIGRVLLPRPADRHQRRAIRSLHVHAFSPMEIMYGARRTGMTYRDYLGMLRDAGLGTIPGTAAEILDDEVREILSHKKVDVRTWVEIITTAHGLGVPIELDRHVRPHRDAGARRPPPRPAPRSQKQTGGFTEFVPAALHPHLHPALPEGPGRRRRRSARSTSASTPSRASCCAAGSTTCRPRG